MEKEEEASLPPWMSAADAMGAARWARGVEALCSGHLCTCGASMAARSG